MVFLLSPVALPRLGVLTPYLPLDSLYQLPQARVRDSSPPLCCHLATRSRESEGALRKEKVPWFQTSVPSKEAACQSVPCH